MKCSCSRTGDIEPGDDGWFLDVWKSGGLNVNQDVRPKLGYNFSAFAVNIIIMSIEGVPPPPRFWLLATLLLLWSVPQDVCCCWRSVPCVWQASTKSSLKKLDPVVELYGCSTMSEDCGVAWAEKSLSTTPGVERRFADVHVTWYLHTERWLPLPSNGSGMDMEKEAMSSVSFISWGVAWCLGRCLSPIHQPTHLSSLPPRMSENLPDGTAEYARNG